MNHSARAMLVHTYLMAIDQQWGDDERCSIALAICEKRTKANVVKNQRKCLFFFILSFIPFFFPFYEVIRSIVASQCVCVPRLYLWFTGQEDDVARVPVTARWTIGWLWIMMKKKRKISISACDLKMSFSFITFLVWNGNGVSSSRVEYSMPANMEMVLIDDCQWENCGCDVREKEEEMVHASCYSCHRWESIIVLVCEHKLMFMFEGFRLNIHSECHWEIGHNAALKLFKTHLNG